MAKLNNESISKLTSSAGHISARILSLLVIASLIVITAAIAFRLLGAFVEQSLAIWFFIFAIIIIIGQYVLLKKRQRKKETKTQAELGALKDKNAAQEKLLYQLKNELNQSKDVLVQAEKMASLGALSAGVAHEINNPVGFMMSNMCTLKEYVFFLNLLTKQLLALYGSLNKHEKINHTEALDAIEATLKIEDLDFVLGDANTLIDESLTGGARIKEITNSMKGYVRDNSEEQVVLVNDMIEQTLNIAWNQIKYNCSLEKNLSKCDQVKLSPSAFNQVLLNIMMNASHAMEDKQGTLTLATYQQEDRVITEIADTGIGIAPDNLSKIFDPFFTTKPAGQGTGLGMSISYDIIKGFGGSIDVDSTLGEGTRFTISLPAHQTEQADA